MKQFVKHTVLFMAPILLLMVLLPWNKRLRYQELKHDCLNHGIWMHDRIHENETPIDILFIGSSHTINGVNDSLIEKRLHDQYHVASMGYCRLGRNLTLTLLKEVLTEKSPSSLVIEVRGDEDRYSHPVYPHLATTSDVLTPPLWVNRDALADVGTHFTYKLELWQDDLYNNVRAAKIESRNYGFLDLDGNAPDTTLVLSKMTKVENPYRNLHMAYPRAYLNRIKDYCDEHNMALYFLYMPSYRGHQQPPKELDTYKRLGTVLLPDSTIYSNKTNWYDPDHLNIPGANALSIWVAEQLARQFEKES